MISSIRIRNFRSIRNELIEAKNMNVFVGLNDVGKSNVLKAINLFFNGQTDYGVTFSFKNDFSFYFPKSSHGTKEIVVEIKFIIPDTYKENGIFTWKKVWRTNDYFDESFLNSDGEKPSDRSRVVGTLRRIKYRYVPAVKSKDYYKSLLSDLYFTVSAVMDSPLEQSVSAFSSVIREYTSKISTEVNERVGINSKLSIPENMSELFKTLIFQTQSETSDDVVPLDMRGDGIQARHIPIILKYIADEDQKTRNQGSMKVATIWGFEEPENGVELSRAFEMANDFLDFSGEIQMFITTHSPAFYMTNDDSTAQVLFVSHGSENEGTKLSQAKSGVAVGKAMGLMPLVAPYIANLKQTISESEKLITDNVFIDIPTILVEGKTDKQYLELAFKLLRPELQNLINHNKLRVFTKDGDGGCKRLIEWAYAWVYGGNRSKAVILFDKDDAGIKAKNELADSEIYKHKRSDAFLQIKNIEPSQLIIDILRKHIDINYEIEHLLSPEFWMIMKKNNYVEPRLDTELYSMTKSIITRDKTVDFILDEKIEDATLIETIVTFNPHKDKKEKIFQLLCRQPVEKQKEYLSGFENTMNSLERIFCIKQNVSI